MHLVLINEMLLLLLCLAKRISAQLSCERFFRRGTTLVNLALLLFLPLHSQGLNFDAMHMSAPNMVFFRWNSSHRLAYRFTSPFLRFIPGTCFIWEGLGLVNFLFYVNNWFHCRFFNVTYVQYGFLVKMSFF